MIAEIPRDTVLLDTNVFTASLNPRSELTPLYHQHIVGKRIAVTPQTVGETWYGAMSAGWGQRRQDDVHNLINRSLVLPPDAETTMLYGQLRAQLKRDGNPLGQKQHLADLWIATTAIRWDIPLVAHDRGFIGCPGLKLITELQTQPAAATDRATTPQLGRPSTREVDR